MAQRWSLNEDIIVCKYCIENPWAYSSNDNIDNIAAKLEAAGFEVRSRSAIRKRAYAYELLLEQRQSSRISRQVMLVCDELTGEKAKRNQEIKSYIREVYKPQEHVDVIEDNSLFSSLLKDPIGLEAAVRKIDYKSTFPWVLQKYVDLKGIKKHNSMCRGIGMKPDTFSAILRGKYKEVKKENVLRICVGLGLHVYEAEELLKSAGFCFSDGDMTDVVVKAHLWDGCYSVVAINAELDENNTKMLFENYVIEYEV